MAFCEGGRIVASLSPELLRRHPADVFVETGTGWGNGIIVALCTGLYGEIYSIEADPAYHDAARDLFEGNRIVHLVHGNSAAAIRGVLDGIRNRALIWLDAHSEHHPNPLFEELAAVANLPVKDHAILIDDRRMWGGPMPCWKDVTTDKVIEAVKRVNPSYEISWADSWNGPKDILVADVPGRGK